MADIVEDSPYTLFLKQDDRKRADKVYKILDFYVAGEELNKKLLFYMILSSYHPELVNFVFYRGDSSAGKNHTINSVFKLFPPDDIFVLDSATSAALNYDQALAGKKIIYLRELNEGNPIIDMLKAMYNPEGYVHKETIRDPETKELMVKTHQKQRIGAITTLSFERLQVDLINRAWVLNPDQSYEQTAKVIDYQINAHANAIEREMQKREIQQDCLFIAQAVKNLDFSFDVFIAFTHRLRTLFPQEHLNVRRDINKILNLIKIITIWNQKNRRVVNLVGKKWLFSEYFDLQEALTISQILFINTVLHIDETKKAILDYMLAMENDPSDIDELDDKEYFFTITQTCEELRADMSISRRTIQRKMNELYYEGYLFREKNKGAYRYKRLKGYDIVSSIRLEDIKDDIVDDIERQYNFWSNKTDDNIINGL